MNIEGATAIVTGSGKRIGRALALALAAQGCSVAVHYNRSAREALETRDAVRELGAQSSVFQADLASAEQCRRLWEGVVKEMGAVPQIVVNNASAFTRSRLNEITPDDFDRVMAVNVRAPLLLAQMLERDLPHDVTGKIVNINDRRRVYSSRIPYGVSRVALSGLTRSLAVAMAPRIQVNELRLGVILPLSDDASGNEQSPSLATLGPAQRMGTLEEVQRAVISLIENDYLNGVSLSVDGGLSAVD